MKKIRLLGVIVIIIIVCTSIYIEVFPFGYYSKQIAPDTSRLDDYLISKDIPNTSIYSYKVEEKFNDKSDIIRFLKKYEAKQNDDMYSLAFDLGSFKNKEGIVSWDDINNSITTEYKLWKKIYTLNYKTSDIMCNGNSISFTENGNILDYRSSGE